MLIRIDDLIVIRSDRHCFMVCHDKGMTKFPKGLVAPYYKPFAYVGCLYEAGNIIIREGASINDKISEIFKMDYDLKQWLKTIIDKDFTSCEIFNKKVNFDRDCFILNFDSFKNYNSTLGSALYECWSYHIREAEEFHEFFDLSLLERLYDDFVNIISGKFNVEFNV